MLVCFVRYIFLHAHTNTRTLSQVPPDYFDQDIAEAQREAQLDPDVRVAERDQVSL